MALERKDYQPVSAQNISTQQHIPMTREQVLTKLDELLNKTMEMQEYTRDQAEAKLQISMLTAIIKEQHELLTAFLEDTKNTQIQMYEKTENMIQQIYEQLSMMIQKKVDTISTSVTRMESNDSRLIDLQSQYKSDIKGDIIKIFRDLFDGQRCVIDEGFGNMEEDLRRAIKVFTDQIDEAAKACNKSVAAADESAASLLRVGAVGTILLVLSPLVAIADIVIRIIQMNM